MATSANTPRPIRTLLMALVLMLASIGLFVSPAFAVAGGNGGGVGGGQTGNNGVGNGADNGDGPGDCPTDHDRGTGNDDDCDEGEEACDDADDDGVCDEDEEACDDADDDGVCDEDEEACDDADDDGVCDEDEEACDDNDQGGGNDDTCESECDHDRGIGNDDRTDADGDGICDDEDDCIDVDDDGTCDDDECADADDDGTCDDDECADVDDDGTCDDDECTDADDDGICDDEDDCVDVDDDGVCDNDDECTDTDEDGVCDDDECVDIDDDGTCDDDECADADNDGVCDPTTPVTNTGGSSRRRSSTPPVVPPAPGPLPDVPGSSLPNGRLSLTLMPGGTQITVFGDDWQPFSAMRLELHSTPRLLAILSVGPDGSFAETVFIPADAEVGDHEVWLIGRSNDGPYVLPLGLEVIAAGVPGPLPEESSGGAATIPEVPARPGVLPPVSRAGDGRLAETGVNGDVTAVLGLLLALLGAVILRRTRPDAAATTPG